MAAVDKLDVLVVDDEPDLRAHIGAVLRKQGHRVTLASDGMEALGHTSARIFHVVIADVRLPKLDGFSLFRRVRETTPTTDVILITGYSSITHAVAALKEGACDYLPKPLDLDEIVIRIARIGEQRRLRDELAQARTQLARGGPGPTIVGRSPAISRLHDRIGTFAQSRAPVLITGETGTGKELVARTLHARGPNPDRPFVAVSCVAFPETLLEAELYGHERGAFTGAVKRREGRFQAADGGTLFLDEIAELPLSAQAKLLRVLEDGMVVPLGSNKPIAVDVRIISATHRNLKERIARGHFREDLYYRLRVLDVHIPPLAERRGDLPLLLQHFLHRFSPPGQPAATISPRAMALLAQYAFPGNVRELAHIVEHGVVLARGGEVDAEHLPVEIAGAGTTPMGPAPGCVRPLTTAMQEFEREYIQRVLNLAGGKRSRTAELLSISRKNLWEKLRQHGIADEEAEA